MESRPGVTYSAYGQGRSRGCTAPWKTAAAREKWSLWYEGDDGRKIWVYDKPMLDCGAIYLEEDLAAKKVQGFWNGQTYQILSDCGSPTRRSWRQRDQAAQPEFDPTHTPDQ